MAVAGHALDCAGLRWNTPTASECAGKHRLHRTVPIAPADCAELCRLLANIALWLSEPGCDLGSVACSFRALPVVPGFRDSLLAAVPAVLRFLFNFQSDR